MEIERFAAAIDHAVPEGGKHVGLVCQQQSPYVLLRKPKGSPGGVSATRAGDVRVPLPPPGGALGRDSGTAAQSTLDFS